MLNVTDDAMQVCTATVQQLSGAQSRTKCLRLIKRGRRVSISFEVPRGDDDIVRSDGRVVLAVPEDVTDVLSDMTLDVNRNGALVLA